MSRPAATSGSVIDGVAGLASAACRVAPGVDAGAPEDRRLHHHPVAPPTTASATKANISAETAQSGALVGASIRVVPDSCARSGLAGVGAAGGTGGAAAVGTAERSARSDLTALSISARLAVNEPVSPGGLSSAFDNACRQRK